VPLAFPSSRSESNWLCGGTEAGEAIRVALPSQRIGNWFDATFTVAERTSNGRWLSCLLYPPKGLGLRSHMGNCQERCQTSKSTHEKQRNLSHAKINRDSYSERTAGHVAATPAPERERIGSALVLDARLWRHSWSTMATWLWKNGSVVHLSFRQGNDEGSRHSHLHRASAADS
jgi:hypothetical protein